MRKFGLNFLSAATGGVRRLPKKYFLSARRRRVPRARSRHRHREVPALSARALADHRGAAASAQHQPEYRGQLPGAAVSRRAWIICVNFKRSASSPQWRCSCTRTAQPLEHMLIASPSSSSSARAHRRRLEYRFYVAAQAPERRCGLKSVPFFNNAKHTRASLRPRATKAAVVLMPRARSDR